MQYFVLQSYIIACDLTLLGDDCWRGTAVGGGNSIMMFGDADFLRIQPDITYVLPDGV